MTEAITSFTGKNLFLSNFYQKQFAYAGLVYNSAEHAYQAAKAVDAVSHETVRRAPSPAIAKRLGRNIVCRQDWQAVKVGIMEDILYHKFAPEAFFRKNFCHTWLLSTGDAELIEGNTWGDTFWGQCPVGNGENMLGKLLMKIRSKLRG